MSEVKSSGPRQLQLVNSSRLQALRTKSTPATGTAQNQPPAKPIPQAEDAETARLRQLVEQRLAQILATLPTDKHRSLFKIRFGIELEALNAMSPQQASKVLKIKV
jgi:hypothetical protein